MILYALACEAGHRFEAWFRDSGSYEEQKDDRLLSCPICASRDVAKSIMAPAVVSASDVDRRQTSPTTDDGFASCEGAGLRDAIRQLRARVFASGQDVGPRFAAEARRIHDGEAPDRHIFGEASLAETRALLADGIMVLPLPGDPDAMN